MYLNHCGTKIIYHRQELCQLKLKTKAHHCLESKTKIILIHMLKALQHNSDFQNASFSYRLFAIQSYDSFYTWSCLLPVSEEPGHF